MEDILNDYFEVLKKNSLKGNNLIIFVSPTDTIFAVFSYKIVGTPALLQHCLALAPLVEVQGGIRVLVYSVFSENMAVMVA